MERPPTPPGPRTCSRADPSSTEPPPPRSAPPRAPSTLRRLRHHARRPASYAAAVSTPPRGGYYAPLVAATPRNNDDPFDTDSGASDDDRAAGESPLLLTDPAEVVAAPANAMANLPATAGVPEDSGARSGVTLVAARDLTDDKVPPAHATPGTAAAVMADFALLLEQNNLEN